MLRAAEPLLFWLYGHALHSTAILFSQRAGTGHSLGELLLLRATVILARVSSSFVTPSYEVVVLCRAALRSSDKNPRNLLRDVPGDQDAKEEHTFLFSSGFVYALGGSVDMALTDFVAHVNSRIHSLFVFLGPFVSQSGSDGSMEEIFQWLRDN